MTTNVRRRAARAVCALHQGSVPCELGSTSSSAALSAVAEWLRSDAGPLLEREIGIGTALAEKACGVLADEIGGP